MKDKEKQIEEMAQDIAYSCADMGYNGCGDKTCCGCIAKSIYDAGYRKIEDHEIVISKDEYERINDTVNLRKVRKETASEILQELYDWLGDDFEELNETSFIHIMKKDYIRRINEIAKQFGVEVEEND